MPFKTHQDRRHHIPEQRHQVTNWAEYDAGLRARGSLTIWLTSEAIEAWRAEPRTTHGGQPCYSALAIATAYRYFPTQEALLVEVSELALAVAPVEAALAALPAGGYPELRLLHLLDAFNPVLFANEASMRTALRVYLDTWFESRRAGEASPAVREGRRKR